MKSIHNIKYILILCLSITSFLATYAQGIKVSGTINDENNKPIPGASIVVKGTKQGTVTNDNGVFTIAVDNANATLVISFIGYQTLDYALSGRQNVIVSLKPASNSLNEVVVTGYTSQRKKDLTGAVSVVSVTDLKAQPAASAVEALQGKATGVQIVNDGAPGATPQIRIRGNSTIGNNEPLYVVDGVPYEGKLSWLNQNDIESLQVLKDASSASIYGARANNGVVIITTKSGTQNSSPKINLDVYYGIQNPQKDRFPTMMNPTQYAQYIFQSYANGGGTYTGANYGTGSTPTLPEYLLAGGALGQNIKASDLDPSKYNYSRDPNTFYQITKANQSGTDWFREISDAAPIQNYQLSTTGGGENAVYAFTGGFLDQQGTLQYTGFKRYNVRTNTKFSALNKKLRFGENMQYSYTHGHGMGVNTNAPGDYQGDGSVVGMAYRMQTIIPTYDVMGNFAGTKGSQLGNARNPLALLYRAKDDVSKSNLFFGNAFAEADIVKGLVARTSFGLKYENYNSSSFGYPDLEMSEGSNNNSVTENSGYNTEWTWTNTLNYSTTFNEKHRLNLLAGAESISGKTHFLSASRTGYFLLGDLNYYYLSSGSANITNTSSGTINSLFSLFGRADYSYADKYLASVTLRRDGSSNFGPNNKYGYFPAASLAWRISEEAFAKESKWLNDLKLRVGYGETGNQRIASNNYLSRYESSVSNSAYPIGGGNNVTTGVWQNSYANEDVKWESLKSLNIGLDFAVLNNTFDGSIDWYTRKTSDMLYQVPQPSTAVGLGTSPFVNIGDMSNKGIEFSLNYHFGKNSDRNFKFDAGFSISRNVNEITKLSASVDKQPYGNFRSLTTSILETGQPFGSFYGYNVAGIYQNAADITGNPSYAGARVGGLKYADVNGDGKLSPDDRTIIGNPNPDFIYSLSLNGSYKNFDFLLFFNGSQGNDIFEATRYFTDFPTFDGARSARLLDAWSPTNTGSMIPSAYSGVSDLEYASSSYYVQDGSYLKLKNVQIGYTLPVDKIFNKKFGISKIRIYASGTNLFTITKYTGLDPEVGQSSSTYAALGVDQGIYPPSRQFLLGLNVGF